jgi:hypothetical protein
MGCSDKRTGLSFIIVAGPFQRSLSRSESHATRDHILLSQIQDFPFCCLLRLNRAMVEVFDPASTRDISNSSQVSCYDRLSVSQSVLE